MLQTATNPLHALIAPQTPPCISLYQPTHRHHPDNAQDPIRFRNLLREIDQSLHAAHPDADFGALLAPFEALAADDAFWNHRTDGLAVLGSASTFEVFSLQRSVQPLAVVADSFHTKPLLRILQSADRFHTLWVSRHSARLFEGNRDAFDEVVLGQEAEALPLAEGEEIDADTQRFFRGIDRRVLELHSRPTGLPLMLATLGEHHTMFRTVSKNPFLIPEGIALNVDALEVDALRALAWQHMEPVYLARLAALVDAYHTASANELASDELQTVAMAALAGRVATLLVEADREIPGRIDVDTGAVELADGADASIDDLLDDLAESVLRTQGDVVIVPTERMPTRTGVAAIYRF